MMFVFEKKGYLRRLPLCSASISAGRLLWIQTSAIGSGGRMPPRQPPGWRRYKFVQNLINHKNLQNRKAEAVFNVQGIKVLCRPEKG
jgi:hypothetical protein